MLGLCLHSTSGGGGGSTDVYFYRPIFSQQTSFYNYDEGWHYINNTDPYNSSIPSTGIIQRIDPNNWFKIVHDDSAVTGVSNLFRFFNPTSGGYYDYSQSTGNRWRASDGSLSTFDDVTLENGINYIVDRLTGYGWVIKEVLSNGTSVSSQASTIAGATKGSYSDLWSPTRGQLETILYDPQVQWLQLVSDNLIFQYNEILIWTVTNCPYGSKNYDIDTRDGRILSELASTTTRASVYMRYHYT